MMVSLVHPVIPVLLVVPILYVTEPPDIVKTVMMVSLVHPVIPVLLVVPILYVTEPPDIVVVKKVTMEMAAVSCVQPSVQETHVLKKLASAQNLHVIYLMTLIGCDQGFRGDACRDRCPVNCKANTCFQYSGSCIECEPWFYGTMCDKTCVSISCKDNICNQTDGQCTECAPGLYGAACDQICPDNCNEECDRITGLCNGCDQGVHGLYCSEICPQNCQSNTCIQDNGHCTECQSGYYGEHCDKICPQNCKDNMCDKTNGDCTDLTETESINTAAIGIGAGFGVVILVLVILVIVQNRRLSMKNKDTTGPINMSDILQRAKTNDIDGPYEEIDTQNGKQLAKNATADNDYDRLDPNDKVVPNLYETA